MSDLQKIVVLCLVGVLVVGGGIFLFKGGGPNAPEGSTSVENSEQREISGNFESEDFNESGMGSLKSLFALGRDLTCTFSYLSEEEGSYSGVVYVSGGSMRGDISMEMEGETFETHIINDNNKAYTWGTSPYGSMAIMVETEERDDDFFSSVDSEDSGGVDYDQDVDYKCSSWRVDRSKFEPPSDIEFQTFGAGSSAVPGVSGAPTVAAPQIDCSLCDQAPAGEARTQCLAALGCN